MLFLLFPETHKLIVIESPENTAGVIGQPAQINCSVSFITVGDALQWLHYLDGAVGKRIWISNKPGEIEDER